MDKNDTLPTIDKIYTKQSDGDDNLSNDTVKVNQNVPVLDGNKVKVDQDIQPDNNRVYIMLCSCFNFL